MRGFSVRTKIFFLFAGAALLTMLPALLLIGRAVENRVYERATEELGNAIDALGTYWARQNDALQESAMRVARERGLAELMREGDTVAIRSALERQVSSGRVVLAADTAGRPLVGPALDSATVAGGGTVVVLSDGAETALNVAVWPVFLDPPEPALEPADPLSTPLAEDPAVEGGTADADSDDEATAIEDPDSLLSVLLPDSVRIGIIGVGMPLDERTITDLRVITGGEVALVAGDSLIGTTLPDSAAAALQLLDLPAMVAGGGSIFCPPIASLPYLIGVSPLLSPDGTMGILLFRSVAEELRIVRGIRQSIVGIGLFALLLALLLALVVARIVARPAQVLAAAATDLAQGSFDAPLPRASGDEIGQLTRAFGEMRSAIAERENRLRSAQAELIHREKLAAMGRLVAQLSHEINNPIYNIQNCLEVLDRRGDPDDPNREFLDLAREELQRMAVLTRQLLDQSRPLADSARPVHLNHLVQRVASLSADRIESQGIELRVRLDPELPTVVAHPDAIQQVLANLVANAIDAMPEGGTLTLRTLAGGETVNVEVEDTGAGISPDDLPHIFEAFYTTKPEVRGIGLGLFVSDGIVRGHRGRLSVDSEPGRGSRFTMQLPRETLGPAAALPARSEPRTARGA